MREDGDPEASRLWRYSKGRKHFKERVRQSYQLGLETEKDEDREVFVSMGDTCNLDKSPVTCWGQELLQLAGEKVCT